MSLELFKTHVLSLNGPVLTNPNADSVRIALNLCGDESLHLEFAAILFHFLKSPSGDPRPTNASPSPLHRLVDVDDPFSPFLTSSALRNWFNLVNCIISSAVGSEARLKFKYLTLAPLAVLTFHMARAQPEFLARLYDYLGAWRKRIVFDNQALDLLVSAYRGEGRSVEKCLSHAEAQIASHFIALRECFARKSSIGGVSASGVQGVSIEEGSCGGGGDSSLFPTYLNDVMVLWNSSCEGASVDVNSESGRVGEVASWYRMELGERLVASIQGGRSEIETKYEPLFSKFRSTEPAELERARGQIVVLLKREFKRRCELMDEELQLISLLDSRHALLTRKFDVFARLRWHLDAKLLLRAQPSPTTAD